MIQASRRFSFQQLKRFKPNKFRTIFRSCPVALLLTDASPLKEILLQEKLEGSLKERLQLLREKQLLPQIREKIRFLEVNPSAVALLEAQNVDKFHDLFLKSLARDSLRLLLEGLLVLHDGNDYFEADIQIKTQKKNKRECQLRMAVPDEYKTDLSGVVISLQDITERKKLERSLRKMAQLDSLTKLFNHHAISSRLEEELNRAERYQLDLSCFMIDVDHFKSMNDRLGHPTGDQILKKVAALIKGNLRRTDIVGRYGGDEFLVILPETKPRKAKVAALRIQTAVKEKMRQYFKKLSIENTLSIGICGYPSSGIKVQKDLIAAADRSMYQAKSAGGNRIVIA